MPAATEPTPAITGSEDEASRPHLPLPQRLLLLDAWLKGFFNEEFQVELWRCHGEILGHDWRGSPRTLEWEAARADLCGGAQAPSAARFGFAASKRGLKSCLEAFPRGKKATPEEASRWQLFEYLTDPGMQQECAAGLREPPSLVPRSRRRRPHPYEWPQDSGLLWRVIAGSTGGQGLAVHLNDMLHFSALGERLLEGSIVEQRDRRGDRLRFWLLEGQGPETGWVSLCTDAGPLVEPLYFDLPEGDMAGRQVWTVTAECAYERAEPVLEAQITGLRPKGAVVSGVLVYRDGALWLKATGKACYLLVDGESGPLLEQGGTLPRERSASAGRSPSQPPIWARAASPLSAWYSQEWRRRSHSRGFREGLSHPTPSSEWSRHEWRRRSLSRGLRAPREASSPPRGQADYSVEPGPRTGRSRVAPRFADAPAPREESEPSAEPRPRRAGGIRVGPRLPDQKASQATATAAGTVRDAVSPKPEATATAARTVREAVSPKPEATATAARTVRDAVIPKPKATATAAGTVRDAVIPKPKATATAARSVRDVVIPKPEAIATAARSVRDAVIRRPEASGEVEGEFAILAALTEQDAVRPKPQATATAAGTVGDAMIPKPEATATAAGTVGDAMIPKPEATATAAGTVGDAMIPKPEATATAAGTVGDAMIPKPEATATAAGTVGDAVIPKPKATATAARSVRDAVIPKPEATATAARTVPDTVIPKPEVTATAARTVRDAVIRKPEASGEVEGEFAILAALTEQDAVRPKPQAADGVAEELSTATAAVTVQEPATATAAVTVQDAPSPEPEAADGVAEEPATATAAVTVQEPATATAAVTVQDALSPQPEAPDGVDGTPPPRAAARGAERADSRRPQARPTAGARSASPTTNERPQKAKRRPKFAARPERSRGRHSAELTVATPPVAEPKPERRRYSIEECKAILKGTIRFCRREEFQRQLVKSRENGDPDWRAVKWDGDRLGELLAQMAHQADPDEFNPENPFFGDAMSFLAAFRREAIKEPGIVEDLTLLHYLVDGDYQHVCSLGLWPLPKRIAPSRGRYPHPDDWVHGSGMLWQVTGGADKGITVRRDCGLNAPIARSTLTKGSVIEEAEMQDGFLKYELASGDGPDIGWVRMWSVARLKPLLVPLFDNLDDEDCFGAAVHVCVEGPVEMRQEPSKSSKALGVCEVGQFVLGVVIQADKAKWLQFRANAGTCFMPLYDEETVLLEKVMGGNRSLSRGRGPASGPWSFMRMGSQAPGNRARSRARDAERERRSADLLECLVDERQWVPRSETILRQYHDRLFDFGEEEALEPATQGRPCVPGARPQEEVDERWKTTEPLMMSALWEGLATNEVEDLVVTGIRIPPIRFQAPGGVELVFYIYEPLMSNAPPQRPAIMFLHGRDIDRSMLGALVLQKVTWWLPAVPSEFTVIIPQLLDASAVWVQQGVRKTLVAFVEQLFGQGIDPTRLYLMGHSMGAIGCWELALDSARGEAPFAAIVPMASRGMIDMDMAPNLAHFPVWCFHGANDTVNEVEFDDKVVTALLDAGANRGSEATLRYTRYEFSPPDWRPENEEYAAGHGVLGQAIMEEDLFPWLLQHRRNAPFVRGPRRAGPRSTSPFRRLASTDRSAPEYRATRASSRSKSPRGFRWDRSASPALPMPVS